MTRGRHTNSGYLYERTAEHEYALRPDDSGPVIHRGTSQDAARLLRSVVAHDEQSVTALGVAAANAHKSLPARIHSTIDQQAAALRRRGNEYRRWLVASTAADSVAHKTPSRVIGTDLSTDYGLEI
jgi:hypothetical protein